MSSFSNKLKEKYSEIQEGIKTYEKQMWPFKNNTLDDLKHMDYIQPFATREKVFSGEECKQIIEIGNKLKVTTGKVGTYTENEESSIRKSEISWLNTDSESRWIYERLERVIKGVNAINFKFDISGMEAIQFTRYKEPDGKYGQHQDSAPNSSVRKLSFTMQLSDPDEYEGGNLYIWTGPEPHIMNKSQGSVVIFPSYMLHEVTPVTRGMRYSLVSWVTGKPFK